MQHSPSGSRRGGGGDTVQVEPSSAPYAEAITIAKSLRLAGPREGIPGEEREAVPDLATEAVIDAPDTATAAVTVTAADVQIDGLFFSGKAALETDSFPAVNLQARGAEVIDNVMVDHVPGVRASPARTNSSRQQLRPGPLAGAIPRRDRRLSSGRRGRAREPLRRERRADRVRRRLRQVEHHDRGEHRARRARADWRWTSPA